MGARQIYRFTGITGGLGKPSVEERVFDPRERPWFRAAQGSATPTWTSIYIDFETAEQVATDLSLQRVSSFLKRLSLSVNGLAMVVENDGKLIGVSRGPHLRMVDGKNLRLNAVDSEDPMVVATYKAVAGMSGNANRLETRTAVFKGPDGGLVQVGYAQLRDEAGLDWLIMVAVPRQDFLQEVQGIFRNAAGLGLLSALGVALIGLAVMGVLTRELGALAAAVKRVSEGDMTTPLTSDRNDELGALARSFGNMQRRLLTDTLTGLSNREAIVRRIEERVLQHRRRGDARPFAVVFIDLNAFKQVNDRFGHDVGDAVLREMAARLLQTVRSDDMVARFAGDEFVVLLESVGNRADAESARAHIDQALRGPLAALAEHDPGETGGGACGLALFPEDGRDVQTLLKAADENMYSRKPRA